MAITSNSIALFSISSSAVVALAGIGIPTWVHISDRRNEARLRLAEKRENTYLRLAHVVSETNSHDFEKAKKLANEMAGLMAIWPTETVRTLFLNWLNLMPTAFGPDKNDAQDKVVQAAGEALRKQMAYEVQIAR